MAAIYYCMFESLSTIQRLEVLEKKQLPDQKGIYGFRMSKRFCSLHLSSTPTQSLISREYRRNTVVGMGRAEYRLEYLLGQNYQYRIYAFQIQL